MQSWQLTVDKAAIFLQQGKVVAYPTEAVFGLGCCPQNPQALESLLTLKQREKSKGLILIASQTEQLLSYIDLSALALERWIAIEQSWPGPYTWVFPATAKVLSWIKGEHTTVAVRVTAHPVARALCEAFGGALVSTSANLSNLPAFTDPIAIYEQFCGRIAGIVAGELGGASKPTTVQDAITGEVYR